VVAWVSVAHLGKLISTILILVAQGILCLHHNGEGGMYIVSLLLKEEELVGNTFMAHQNYFEFFYWSYTSSIREPSQVS
jgi:hypothetical protein